MNNQASNNDYQDNINVRSLKKFCLDNQAGAAEVEKSLQDPNYTRKAMEIRIHAEPLASEVTLARERPDNAYKNMRASRKI